MRGGTTLSGQITFSGASVGGIESSDFEVLDLHNRPLTGWLISIDRNIVFAGVPVNVVASPPPNTNQSFRLRLKRLSVMSDGSRTNNAPSSAVTSISRSVRNVIQLASSTWSNIAGGTTLTGVMTFRLARVTEINTTDFSVVNLSNVVQGQWGIAIAINTFSSSVVVNVTATPPAGTNGSYKLQLNALSVRSETSNDTPVQNVISQSAPINNVPSYLVATASWTEESGGDSFTGKLTFNGADVTNIGQADFEVYTTTGTRQYGWGILVEATSLSDGESITVAAVPPANTRGSFKVRLKQLSVRSGGLPITQTPNAPTNNVDSGSVTIDNIVRVTVESFTPPEGIQRGSTSTFRLAFNTDIVVSELTTSDFRTFVTEFNISAVNAIDPINGKADEFDVVVDNPADTRGVYLVRLNPNTIPSTSEYLEGPAPPGAGSFFVRFDTRAFGANWFNMAYDTTNNRLRGQIVFTHEVRHISNNDFEVVRQNTDMSLTVQSGWTIGYGLNANPPRAANIFAIPPANTNGSFALRLKANSLRYDGESELNGPPSAIISPFVDINNVSYSIATMIWTLEMGGSTISARLTFRDATVTGVEASDFEILDEDDNVYPSNLWPISIVENTGPPHYVAVTGTPNAIQRIKGSYRLNLKSGRLMSGGSPENNAPINDIPSAAVVVNTLPDVSVTSFTAESGIIRRTTANFEITFNTPILRDELTTSDFSGGNVVSVGSLVAGDRSTRFKVVANNPSNGVGTYRLILNRNAIPDGTSYNEGPSTAAQSDLVRYNTRASTVTGSWGTVSAPDSNRSVTATLTFTGNPGATFDIDDDIVIQVRILTFWQDRPIIWAIRSDGSTSPTSKPMRATPSSSVAAGTYRFLLKGGALGVGSPAAASDPFTIGAPPEVPTAIIVEAEQRFLTS